MSAAAPAIEAYVPWARRQALAMRRGLPAAVDVDDLTQIACLALLDVAQRYRGEPAFTTFAYPRIRGAMVDWLRADDWRPRGVLDGVRRRHTAISRLQQRLGRPPAVREIAAEMDLSPAGYAQLCYDYDRAHGEEYVDTARPETAASVPAPEHTEPFVSPFDAAAAADQRAAVHQAVAALPDPERAVITAYYNRERTLRAIGASMGLSEGRVCQIHRRALARLRASALLSEA